MENNKIKDIKSKIHSDVEEAKLTIRELKTKKKELKTLKDKMLAPYEVLDTDKTNKYAGQINLS